MNKELDQKVGAFLATHHVMSLATFGSSGPHATSLFYACDGLALVWVSEPASQHSRDIEADQRVAATVAPDYSDFEAIRGVQIAGARLTGSWWPMNECGTLRNWKRVTRSSAN